MFFNNKILHLNKWRKIIKNLPLIHIKRFNLLKPREQCQMTNQKQIILLQKLKKLMLNNRDKKSWYTPQIIKIKQLIKVLLEPIIETLIFNAWKNILCSIVLKTKKLSRRIFKTYII